MTSKLHALQQGIFLPGAAIQGGGGGLTPGGWDLDPCKLLQCPPEKLCKPGEIRVIPEGQCCPECQAQDCSTVKCPDPPTCVFFFESLQVPQGECCPQCVPIDPCALIKCPAPPPCELWGLKETIPEGGCCPVCQ